jgi:hypothetical protein
MAIQPTDQFAQAPPLQPAPAPVQQAPTYVQSNGQRANNWAPKAPLATSTEAPVANPGLAELSKNMGLPKWAQKIASSYTGGHGGSGVVAAMTNAGQQLPDAHYQNASGMAEQQLPSIMNMLTALKSGQQTRQRVI